MNLLNGKKDVDSVKKRAAKKVDKRTENDIDLSLNYNADNDNAYDTALKSIMIIYSAWARKENNELKSRKVFSWIYQILLILQLISVNVIVFLIGFGVIKIEKELFHTFAALIIAELIGIVVIMIKYIFSERKTKVLEEAYKIISLIIKSSNTTVNKEINDEKESFAQKKEEKDKRESN